MQMTQKLQSQREYFKTGQSKDILNRIDFLKRLYQTIIELEPEINAALKADLGKSPFESYVSEIGICLQEIRYMIKNIKKWTKPINVKTPFVHWPGKSMIYKEPYGLVLVMGAWNYPFQLSILPTIGAIAAGNCVSLKTPPAATETSKVIQKISQKLNSTNFFTVYDNGIEESQALLNERFDYIFYTGGSAIGKVVMNAAAQHLTPVTLELGGKSPCIIEPDADLKTTARRVIWGKFLNSGQTCVAPDYLLVHKKVEQNTVSFMVQEIENFFSQDPQKSSDYGRIINQNHYNRLKKLLSQGNLIFGGSFSDEDHYIGPTLIQPHSLKDSLMKEEIFGPILPILTYENIEQAYQIIESMEKPLALYLFTKNKKTIHKTIGRLSFGGGAINDTIVHIANENLPFGGVGLSGLGAYHGKYSFELFSHSKSILKRGIWPDFKMRYPPYSSRMLKLIKKIIH